MQRTTLLLVALLSGSCASFSEGFRRDLALNATVRVQADAAHPVENKQIHEQGAGVIVGYDEKFVYIVTARHVLLPEADGVVIHVEPSATRSGARARGENPILRPKRYKPDPFEEPDLALFRVRRDQTKWLSTDPHLRIQGPSLRLNDAVFVLGATHGLQRDAPGVAKVGSENGDRPDTVNLVTTQGNEQPAAGDSGGGVFDQQWQLVGIYTGLGNSRRAYRFDSVSQIIRGNALGGTVPLGVSPAYHPAGILGLPLTIFGATLLVSGVTVGVVAHAKRDSYWDHPTGSNNVTALNVTADALMITGAAVLALQIGRWVAVRIEEQSIRSSWAP